MRWLITLLGGIGFLYIIAKKWAEDIYQTASDNAQADIYDERQRFLQRLDHELKNPLTAMQIALANLEETENPAKRSEIRAGMRGQLLRIAHLVSDLRKLATLENNPIEQLPVNVAEMLDEITLIFQDNETARRRLMKIDQSQRPLPVVIGDRDLLQLALYNLIDNAVKFTNDGDSITLTALENDGEMVFRVKDTGRGIAAYDLPHVWKDLYRGRGVHGTPGSGIGLSMVRTIVERHDGYCSIASDEGRGTTVTLRIPIGAN